MDAYTGFAQVYDTLMDNVPYKEWGERIIRLLRHYGVTGGLMLDLGCGTGNLTEFFARAGYDMIGVDISSEMLSVALEKKQKSGLDILYLEQDMRELELYGTVSAAVCCCDTLNYILKYDEFVSVLRLVNNYLDPEGIFIFDLNTIFKYEQIGDSVIAENREACSFIWENSWHNLEKINEYDLNIFIREEDGRYRRFTETHFQRGYAVEQVVKAVEEAGMELLDIQDDMGQAPMLDSGRIYVIAREKGKSKEIRDREV